MVKSYQSITVEIPPGEDTPLIRDNHGAQEIHASHHRTSITSRLAANKILVAVAVLGVWCTVLMLTDVPLSLPGFEILSSRRDRGLVNTGLGSESGSGANTIKVCVEEMDKVTANPSEGSHVKCYDKDANNDDLMGQGITDDDGCVTISYRDLYWDLHLLHWQPDIICEITKENFVKSVPPIKNNWNPGQQATFYSIIYRDRVKEGDYGAVKGCGPYWSQGIVGGSVIDWITGFESVCNNHDKCYDDCQIREAVAEAMAASGRSATISIIRAGQYFCDMEMKAAMDSICYENHGNVGFLGGLTLCLSTSEAIFNDLQQRASFMYEDMKCPNNSTHNVYVGNDG